MKMLEFTRLSLDEFAIFSECHKYASFLQSKEEYIFKLKEGYDCFLIGVKDNDVIVAATFLYSVPVMKIYTYFYAPRGFLLDYNDENLLSYFLENLKRFLYSKKCLYLKFEPYVPYIERDKSGNIVPNGFDNSKIISNLKKQCIHGGFTKGFNSISQARWLMVMDLENMDKESILLEMDQQTRWSIHKTLKQGIKIKELSLNELNIFLDMMEHTAKRRHFDLREKEYYIDQFKYFGSKAKVILAYLDTEDFIKRMFQEKNSLQVEFNNLSLKLEEHPNSKKYKNKSKVCEEALRINERNISYAKELQREYGEIIPMASAFFILHGNSCTYLHSAAYSQFSTFNAPYAIQWYMIQYALSKKLKYYNFYGISGDFNKESDDYGVYKFKQGFNSHVVELIGDFYLPIRKTNFYLYNKFKNVV